MVTVYIVRHGQTRENIYSQCLGRSDSPLTDAGRDMAEALAERMKNIDIDAFYSSPLSRAADTLKPLAEERDIICDIRLTERDWGEWEGLSLSEIAQKFPAEYAEFDADKLNYPVPGGELSSCVQERVNSFMNEILPEYEGKTVVIGTHLGTARHCLSYLLGLKADESWRFWLDNASYAMVKYDLKVGCGVLHCLGG